MKNVTYIGSYQHNRIGAIAAPQHCGIGRQTDATCMIHYLFERVRFLNSGTAVSFGASGGSPLAPAYISFDGSIRNGDKVAISPFLNGFRNGLWFDLRERESEFDQNLKFFNSEK